MKTRLVSPAEACRVKNATSTHNKTHQTKNVVNVGGRGLGSREEDWTFGQEILIEPRSVSPSLSNVASLCHMDAEKCGPLRLWVGEGLRARGGGKSEAGHIGSCRKVPSGSWSFLLLLGSPSVLRLPFRMPGRSEGNVVRT